MLSHPLLAPPQAYTFLRTVLLPKFLDSEQFVKMMHIMTLEVVSSELGDQNMNPLEVSSKDFDELEDKERDEVSSPNKRDAAVGASARRSRSRSGSRGSGDSLGGTFGGEEGGSSGGGGSSRRRRSAAWGRSS